MSYYILDTATEKGLWEVDDPKLIGVEVKEVTLAEFKSFEKKINGDLQVTSDVEEDIHPLPEEVTTEVVRKYSAAELTVHYSRGDAIKLAKSLNIGGYSKFKIEELWQYLKNQIEKL